MNRNVQDLSHKQKVQIHWLVIERLKEHDLLTVYSVSRAMNSRICDLTDLIEYEILDNIIKEEQ